MIFTPLLLKTKKSLRIIVGHQNPQNIERIEGWYGSDPETSELGSIRQKLTEFLTQKLKEQNAESWFIPRFLGAALVFVLVFFVLSFGIRDPLPYVDEVLIALLASFLVFWSWSRAGLKSLEFKYQLSQMNDLINQATFHPLKMLKDMEVILGFAENLSPSALWEELESASTNHPQHHLDPILEIIIQEGQGSLKKWENARKKFKNKTLAQKAALLENWMAEGHDVPFLLLVLKVNSVRSEFLPSISEAP